MHIPVAELMVDNFSVVSVVMVYHLCGMTVFILALFR